MRAPLTLLLTAALPLLTLSPQLARGGDWTGFRGSDGSGVVTDDAVPTQWSSTENLKWKAELPGPGSSSPIILGDRIYLTCYSGYGESREEPGSPSDLKRHLVCLDRNNGKLVWETSVAAVLPEDDYQGFITEHGYASSTPVTDGKSIYVFFGKTGVLAYDLDGKKQWQTDVGQESSSRHWGSGASPILFENLVIVNASDESQSLRALDKTTGREVWKAEAAGLEMTFATPRLVESPAGKTELVLGVPSEVWGLDPATGKLTWYAESNLDGNVSPTLVAHDGIVYLAGGLRGGSLAVKTGGEGDVTDSHVVWTSRESTYVPSPVYHKGHLYWISDRAQAYCLNAETGDLVYRERLAGGDDGGGRRGASRGFYASVLVVGDKLIAVSRTDGTYVLDASPTFKVVARNVLEGDDSDFNATPAVSDGELFLRSNRFLYCIAE